jgi:hypothetical protein
MPSSGNRKFAYSICGAYQTHAALNEYMPWQMTNILRHLATVAKFINFLNLSYAVFLISDLNVIP